MNAALFFRLAIFFLMALAVGFVAAFSAPGAITGAIMAFGYGVSEICDAITEARQ